MARLSVLIPEDMYQLLDLVLGDKPVSDVLNASLADFIRENMRKLSKSDVEVMLDKLTQRAFAQPVQATLSNASTPKRRRRSKDNAARDEQIRNLRAQNVSPAEIADKFGISVARVSQITANGNGNNR